MKYSILFIALLVIILGGSGATVFYLANQEEPLEAVYETASPESRRITRSLFAVGRIEPDVTVSVKPEMRGTVVELLVQAGDVVLAGDIIARLEPVTDPLDVNDAEFALATAQSELIHAREALAVADTACAVSEQHLSVAREAQRAADADLAFKQRDLAHEEHELALLMALIEGGTVSDSERRDHERRIDNARNAVTQAEQAALEASQQVDDATQSLRDATLARDNARRTAETTALQVQNRERALQVLMTGSADGLSVNNTLIRATASGTIMSREVEEGDFVTDTTANNEGTTIVTIADMDAMVFRGEVSETTIARLETGMSAQLNLATRPNDPPLEAVLYHLAPRGNESDNPSAPPQYEITARISPAENFVLRSGYSATAEVILEAVETDVAIRERFIIEKDGTYGVEVQTGDDFEWREVELGLSDGIWVEVISGLSTADIIRTEGNPESAAGQPSR